MGRTKERPVEVMPDGELRDLTQKEIRHWKKQLKNPHAVALGRLGGKAKSRVKKLAVRKNGSLGGRPKKLPPEPSCKRKEST
jgi:hypothetical protein